MPKKKRLKKFYIGWNQTESNPEITDSKDGCHFISLNWELLYEITGIKAEQGSYKKYRIVEVTK